MSATELDVLSLGDAIVDILAMVDDAFLAEHGLEKGAMAGVDQTAADRLHAAMGEARVVAGGSAANTAVGAAVLGARAGFVGKVRDDVAGRLFVSGMSEAGVAVPVPAAREGAATGRCIVLVTPDGERTMNTHLGICQHLGADDVDEALVASAAILLVEGYLWEPPLGREACAKAMAVARSAGRTVAFTLSDARCVERCRDGFRDLVRMGAVDVVFANKAEIRALYDTADEDAAVEAFMAESAGLLVVTRSGDGAYVASGGLVESVPAHPVSAVVDTTGAGDSFSAGFLVGLSRGLAHRDCAALGGLAAAHVIQRVGARPGPELPDLARAAGFGA